MGEEFGFFSRNTDNRSIPGRCVHPLPCAGPRPRLSEKFNDPVAMDPMHGKRPEVPGFFCQIGIQFFCGYPGFKKGRAISRLHFPCVGNLCRGKMIVFRSDSYWESHGFRSLVLEPGDAFMYEVNFTDIISLLGRGLHEQLTRAFLAGGQFLWQEGSAVILDQHGAAIVREPVITDPDWTVSATESNHGGSGYGHGCPGSVLYPARPDSRGSFGLAGKLGRRHWPWARRLLGHRVLRPQMGWELENQNATGSHDP